MNRRHFFLRRSSPEKFTAPGWKRTRNQRGVYTVYLRESVSNLIPRKAPLIYGWPQRDPTCPIIRLNYRIYLMPATRNEYLRAKTYILVQTRENIVSSLPLYPTYTACRENDWLTFRLQLTLLRKISSPFQGAYLPANIFPNNAISLHNSNKFDNKQVKFFKGIVNIINYFKIVSDCRKEIPNLLLATCQYTYSVILLVDKLL